MKHRTAIVTAASVAVVILAATAAIATNLGILTSGTDTGEVGALTVATTEQVEVPPAPVVKVTDDATSTSTTVAPQETTDSAASGEITAYAVADAGIVTLENDGSMLTIIDVETNTGWQTAQILDGTAVDIGFVNGDGTVLRFIAVLNPDGSVQTLVDDLTPVLSSDDDDDRYEDDDDDRYEKDDDDRYEADDDD